VIRCPWCGAKNYAIDMWCTKCQHHLEWGPSRSRRRRGASRILPPVAAAAGIALALSSPVAAWHAGSLQLSLHALPNTGAAVGSASTSQARQSQALAPTPAATAAPTPAAPTAEPTATPDLLPTPAAGTPHILAPPPVYSGPAPPEVQPVGDPTAAVQAFYQAVSSHQFATAATYWSPAMKAAYPPAIYIDHRFAATQQINLTGSRVLSDQAGTAVIYVDVLEIVSGHPREWVGTWQLVQGQSRWLLNSPNLSGA